MSVSDIVSKHLQTMTMEQKVGQMLCFGFCGTYPHPDILEAIEKYHVAGFRVTPAASKKFYSYLRKENPATARVARPLEPLEREYGAFMRPAAVPSRRYAEILNILRQRSLDTGAGIPLYFSLDFEGNLSADYRAPGIVNFPHPMGLTASGDPSLCRRVARVVGRQLHAVGINWLHSPVLDVNTMPTNPEIGTRSYSALPEVVSEYAAETLAGMTEAKIIATGKHFPGRGHSSEDVHFGLATIPESRERMHAVHLAPYKALIEKGLPAIMLAHSVFPGIDPEEEIATLSKAVITDVLRGELGFDGVIMTDSFTMGGLVARYEVTDAAIKCIQAGVDLILLKDENALRGETADALLAAAKDGRISEARLNEAVAHVLTAKERCGLFEAPMGIVDLDAVDDILATPEHREVAAEAADKSIVVLRNQDGLVPLPKDARVFVVEHVIRLLMDMNNPQAHPNALLYALLDRGVQAVGSDFDMGESGDSFERIWKVIQQRATEADVVVHTGLYERGKKAAREIHERFATLNTPTLFVANSPYEEIVAPDMRNVLVTFSVFAESMRAVADVLTGATRPTASLGFDPGKVY